MPRQARESSPTNYYHIMMRGNNKEKIFDKKEQKFYFTDLLKTTVTESGLEIAAWCLMSNHVHIIAQGELSMISASLKKLNTKYAMVYNKKNERAGHVFQDRFKSEVIKDDPYLLNVVRYVHNNPVKANIVKHPDDYKWSSYREYTEKVPGIINSGQKKFIMAYFNNNLNSYKKFHIMEDFIEYLDTDEEIEHNRMENVKSIINTFCHERDLADITQIAKSSEYKKEIVNELLEKTSLSHRKIADLLGIDRSVIYRLSTQNNKLRDN